MGKGSRVDIHDMPAVIHYVNSIVNPLVYAIRMQEFRKALGNTVSRQRQADQRRQRRAEQKRAHRSQPETNLSSPTGKDGDEQNPNFQAI